MGIEAKDADSASSGVLRQLTGRGGRRLLAPGVGDALRSQRYYLDLVPDDIEPRGNPGGEGWRESDAPGEVGHHYQGGRVSERKPPGLEQEERVDDAQREGRLDPGGCFGGFAR